MPPTSSPWSRSPCIGGPALDRGTFAQALADAGIPCYGCGGVLPDQMVLDMAPYVWGTAPSPDQFLGMLDAWTTAGEELDGVDVDVANFAGGDLQGEPRKVGVIHFEQDPPIYGETSDEQPKRFGVVDFTETYILDLPNMPAKATELIAKLQVRGRQHDRVPRRPVHAGLPDRRPPPSRTTTPSGSSRARR